MGRRVPGVVNPRSGRPLSLDLTLFNEMLLESTVVGLGILDPESLGIVFHNRRLREWFPDLVARETTLTDLFPDLDIEALRARLESGRACVTEAEVVSGRRPQSLAVRIDRPADDVFDELVLECTNTSKIKELEYMIESYAKMIEKQNRTLEKEKERVERLLLNIMPRRVYEEMKTFGVTTPQRFESASVLMLDFVDFTKKTLDTDPSSLIAELNDIFTSFDKIAEQFGCERIKTIGDAYMAVCGVPEPVTDHAQAIAKTALLFRSYIERRNAQHAQKWHCRIGIAAGPAISSIVGVQKYVYDIFGPAVNLASRMETVSGPMEITLDEGMREMLGTDFRVEERGEEEVKGFGRKRLYRLVGESRAGLEETYSLRA